MTLNFAKIPLCSNTKRCDICRVLGIGGVCRSIIKDTASLFFKFLWVENFVSGHHISRQACDFYIGSLGSSLVML